MDFPEAVTLIARVKISGIVLSSLVICRVTLIKNIFALWCDTFLSTFSVYKSDIILDSVKKKISVSEYDSRKSFLVKKTCYLRG